MSEEKKLQTTGQFNTGQTIPEAGTIQFHTNDPKKEIMKITPEGEVFVHGRKIETDEEIREGLREWLKAMGYIR